MSSRASTLGTPAGLGRLKTCKTQREALGRASPSVRVITVPLGVFREPCGIVQKGHYHYPESDAPRYMVNLSDPGKVCPTPGGEGAKTGIAHSRQISNFSRLLSFFSEIKFFAIKRKPLHIKRKPLHNSRQNSRQLKKNIHPFTRRAPLNNLKKIITLKRE
jgi:hypothetical protein